MFGIEGIKVPKVITVNPNLEAELFRLIRMGKPPLENVESLAQKFFQKYIGLERNFLRVLQMSLDLGISIDNSKIRKFGQSKEHARISNQVIGCLFSMAASVIDPTEQELELSSKMKEKVAQDQSELGWFYPKVTIFDQQLKNKCGTLQWGERLHIPGAEAALELLETNLPGLSSMIDDLMKELLNLRKYGVKNCYFQDGILHAKNDAWLFLDFFEFSRMIPVDQFRALSKKYVALLALAGKDDITDLHWNRADKQERSWQTFEIFLPGKSSFLWAMDWKGDLHILSLYSSCSVRDLFISLGKEVEYELLRLSQIMRLYDLVVPLTVVSQLPVLPAPKTGLGSIVSTVGSALKGSKIVTPELIIPRLRKLENPSPVLEDLLQEIEEAERTTKDRAKVGRHEVINFIRLLPKGHKASAKAKRLAWEEQGIELQEGETYVQKHERGEGELKSKSHKAHRRKK